MTQVKLRRSSTKTTTLRPATAPGRTARRGRALRTGLTEEIIGSATSPTTRTTGSSTPSGATGPTGGLTDKDTVITEAGKQAGNTARGAGDTTTVASLTALQEQTNALNEGLRRASQAHEITQSRLTETETQLAAARAAQTAQGSQERSLIHPSNVPKPPTYNGKKEEWEKFKHIFTAWSSTVHGKYPELLEKYGAAKDPLDEAAFTEEDERLAKAMYTFLMQYCPEPTLNVIGQGLHDANGFEIWRRLVRLSEPSYRTKACVWRKHLSNPNFPPDIATWSTALHQWESELREYEKMFTTPFSEDEKVSVLAHVSPKELQQSIFMHSDALNSYSKMRNYIEQHLVNKNVWKRLQGSQFGLTRVTNKVDDGGPMPMDIG